MSLASLLSNKALFARPSVPPNVDELKQSVLTTMSALLITEANEVPPVLAGQMYLLAGLDPLFTLKILLYVRLELGIRKTPLLLLALLACRGVARQAVVRLGPLAIRTPQDFAAVLDACPRPLTNTTRKLLTAAFASFDTYQLSKYAKNTGSLKAAIRTLHLGSPALVVMSVLGKRYPSDAETFRKSGLPGFWEEKRAGQRLRLPVADTWETVLAAEGNTAESWEGLLDRGKLPFMAMLRNIRNMLQAGISPAHHAMVLGKLRDEATVANSRQFPFRFLAAVDAIPETVDALVTSCRHPPKRGPAQSLLDDYRAALDDASRAAARRNIQPLPGTTLLLVDVSTEAQDAPVARAASRAIGSTNSASINMATVSSLLAVLLASACESPTLLTSDGKTHRKLNLSASLLDQAATLASSAPAHPFSFPLGRLHDAARDGIALDNLIVFATSSMPDEVRLAAARYRHATGHPLLLVWVNTSSSDSGIVRNDPLDVTLNGFSDGILRFVAERGTSTALAWVNSVLSRTRGARDLDEETLEKLAETGLSAGRAGKKKNKSPQQQQQPRSASPSLPLAPPRPASRLVRVFVSSTFTDFHGERDVLTRVVFPALRERGRRVGLEIAEIDLRWGVSSDVGVAACLDTVMASAPLFVGMIGMRSGMVVSDAAVLERARSQSADPAALDWLTEKLLPQSLTGLEFEGGVLRDPRAAQAVIALRGSSFLRSARPDVQALFGPESPESHEIVQRLRARVRRAAAEYPENLTLVDGYKVGQPATPGERAVVGLDAWATHMTVAIWRAVQRAHPTHFQSAAGRASSASAVASPEEVAQHDALTTLSARLVGRSRELRRILDLAHPLLLITGPPGIGRSALCACAALALSSSRRVVYHNVAASLGERSLLRTLARVAVQLGADEAEVGAVSAIDDVRAILRRRAAAAGGPVLVLDGLELLEHGETLLSNPVPGLYVVASSVADLDARQPHILHLTPLATVHRATLAAALLWDYRKKLEHMDDLIAKEDAGLPLFLATASAELRLHGTFETLRSAVRSLPATADALIRAQLSRVARDTATCPGDFAASVLGALALAADGLTADEIVRLMGEAEPAESRRHLAVLQCAAAGLVAEVPTASGILRLRSLRYRAVAESLFVGTASRASLAHGRLAAVFGADATVSDRAARCAIAHLVACGRVDEAASTAADLRVVSVRLRVSLPALLSDYTHLLSLSPSHSALSRTLRLVRRHAAILTEDPTLLAQCALNSGFTLPHSLSPSLYLSHSLPAHVLTTSTARETSIGVGVRLSGASALGSEHAVVVSADDGLVRILRHSHSSSPSLSPSLSTFGSTSLSPNEPPPFLPSLRLSLCAVKVLASPCASLLCVGGANGEIS
jgi:telomerase protein component 1